MIFFMTRKERLTLWSDRVANYRSSGIGLRNWCSQQQVNMHSMRYWTQKLRHSNQSTAAAFSSSAHTQWYALDYSTQAVAPTPLQIRVGEASIEVSQGFDPEMLRDVVRVLTRC